MEWHIPTLGRLKVGRSQVQSNPACPASSRLGSALEKTTLKANKIHLLLSFFFSPPVIRQRESLYNVFYLRVISFSGSSYKINNSKNQARTKNRNLANLAISISTEKLSKHFAGFV